MAAPSAMNRQPWVFVVVDDKALLQKFADSPILLYFPCIATVAAIGSEAGWRWAVAIVAYITLLAWLAAWAVYHLVMWL